MKLALVFALLALHATCALGVFTTPIFTLPAGPANSNFGDAVAIDGDNAVVGSTNWDDTASNEGRVHFYRRSGGTWAYDSDFASPDPTANGYFGTSVAIDDDWAAVAAYNENGGEGRVYMFQFSGGSWSNAQTLERPASSAGNFGSAVAIDGTRLAVGDNLDLQTFASQGSVTFYDFNGSAWVFNEEETPTSPTSGMQFGLYGFALVGDYFVGGAWQFNDGANNAAGRAWVFKNTGGVWNQAQVLANPAPSGSAYFGWYLDLDMSVAGEEILAIGSFGSRSVHFYEFVSGTGTFSFLYTLQETPEPGTGFLGYNVAVGSGLVLASDWSSNSNNGRVIVFARNEVGTFEQVQAISGTAGEGFGRGLAVSDDGTALIGAYASGTGQGRAYFYHNGTLVQTEDSENPLRCGEYDDVSQRYFYDDGTGCESTPTVSDACYYSAGDLVTSDAATLRVDLSELKADGGEDYIYLAFDLADKYYNTRLVFADATVGECEHADWEQVSATRDVTSLDACETTFVYRLPWSDAYSAAGDKCGWDRDESGANVKLVLDFAVRADEDLSASRNGTTIRRAVAFSMPVEVQFPTQVTASPVTVQVFAPVRVLAAVTSQAVTIDEVAVEATLTVELFTEVQNPFELFGIVESTDVMPTGVVLETTMSDGVVRQDAECTDGNADCSNTWRWQYSTPSVAGGSNPCDFDGTYQVTFGVRCSDVAETNCPIDGSTDSVEITLTVSTSNHCPTVIDSVDLSAALAVYDLPARAVAQDDFVGDGVGEDGQTPDLNDWQVAYFAAPVTSTQVAIDRTEFNQVWIVRHQETVSVADDDVVVLLDADDTIDVSPYDGVGEIDCAVVAGVNGADATATAVSAASGCSPAKDGVGGTYSFEFKHGEGGNSAAGEASTPIFEFDVRTDAAGFDMADDAIEEMQVNAVIDVEYANAAKRTGGAVQNNAQQSTVTSSFSMRTTGSTTSSSGSTALFGMNATVLYGAGAFLVIAVLAALVVISRKRSPGAAISKLQSTTELTTAATV